MFKRIFSLIICIALCATMLPVAATAQTQTKIYGEKIDELAFKQSLLTDKPSAININYFPGRGGLQSATDGDPNTYLRIRSLRPFTIEFDLGQLTNFDRLCLIEDTKNGAKEITISYSDDRENWKEIGPLISQHDLKQTVSYDFDKLPPIPDTAKDYVTIGAGVGRSDISDIDSEIDDTEDAENTNTQIENNVDLFEEENEEENDEEGEEENDEEGEEVLQSQDDNSAKKQMYKFNSWRFPTVRARYVNINFSRVTTMPVIYELQLFSSVAQTADFDANISVPNIESTVSPQDAGEYDPQTAPFNEFNPEPKDSSLVWEDENGNLQYAPYSELGDTLPDFSTVGYKHGNVPIPDVPVKEVLEPIQNSEDDSVRIQEAINRVGKLPLDVNGVRGAVLLKKGRYTIKNGLTISQSGVVLRGEGKGDDGTVLYDIKKTEHTAITIKGNGDISEQPGTRTEITDLFVPVGSKQFHVADASMFNIGDEIVVHTMKNDNWINELEVGDSGFLESKTKWTPESYQFYNRKTIVDIDDNLITVDVAIMDALDKRFDYSQIYAYSAEGRIVNSGVENLQLESYFDKNIVSFTQKGYGEPFLEYTDTNHVRNAFAFNGAADCWARNVACKYTSLACVSSDSTSMRLTFENCDYLDGVSPISGGYRYPFNAGAEQLLFNNCYAYRARHDFVSAAQTPGPNVYVDCYAENSYGNSECHQRWGYGTLYDNVKFDGGGYLTAGNRGISGSGHGWSGSNMVFWNCFTPVIIVQKPPTAQNFAIGVSGTDFEFPDVLKRGDAIDFFEGKSGKFIEDTGNVALGDAFIENPTNPNKITSLYKRQYDERKKSVYSLYAENLLLSTFSENAISNGVRRKLNDGNIYEKPQLVNGTMMVPADVLTYYLDAEYTAEGDVYKFAKGDDSITLTVGNAKYSSNDENKSFSAAPYIHNGNLFVPLRSFMEAFGKETLWLGNGCVIVTSHKDLQPSAENAQKLHNILSKAYDPMPSLSSISINGKKLEEFSSNVRAYTVEMETNGVAPVITAESFDGFKIGEFDKISRTTQIVAYNKNNHKSNVVYEVKFLDNSLEAGVGKQSVSTAYSINEKEGTSPSVKNMYDNDLTTAWASNGVGKWAEFTLEKTSAVSAVGIAFVSGDARRAVFQIQVSQDGYTWTTVFDGESSGKTSDIELFRFKETPCRYIRYVGNGNSVSGWNNIAELEIYGK